MNDKGEGNSYNEYFEENGRRYRVPYRSVRHAVLNNIRKEELVDPEHAARLQYRLLLLEPVLNAKVEFAEQRITVTYNPTDARNRSKKTSLQEIVKFLADEGIRVDQRSIDERDVDYLREIYNAQYNSRTIREHSPYGYTMEEWRKGMKGKYEKKLEEYDLTKKKKFREWQVQYLREHPELAQRLGVRLE